MKAIKTAKLEKKKNLLITVIRIYIIHALNNCQLYPTLT